MAAYSALIGHRVDVTYRAGDVVLPVTGTLAADSGKSIFLEESYLRNGSNRTFRWEIPYNCIIQLNEHPEIPLPSASLKMDPEQPTDRCLTRSQLQLNKRSA
jgi:hypothetical protein